MKSKLLHVFLVLFCTFLQIKPLFANEPIELGTERELFVDDFLILDKTGSAKFHLHQPQPQEVVLVTNKPWEGNTCAYYTLFQDGNRYRMYFRGWNHDEKTKKPTHREVTCYAESKDGIHWERPNLGLFAFAGSKENNIVWDGIGTHNFTPFKDQIPGCPEKLRYKALGRGSGKYKRALYAFASPDGIHWKLMKEEPVITKGAFDSQNLAFWDPATKVYREFHRGFRNGKRDIMTGVSKDFLQWSDPVFLNYYNAKPEHLYTNTIRPYERAPHILIGFPTRYLPHKGSQTEPVFMSSRDGRNFKRWNQPVISTTAPKDRDGNRSNYMTWGLVKLPGDDKHYSVYASEAYYQGPDSRLRRFTYRVDGFVSIRSKGKGTLITKPILFQGNRLELNFQTGAGGSFRVEIQELDGKPLPGFALDDCPTIRGDSIDHLVSWKHGRDLSKLTGTAVRLRFEMENADLFSLRFPKK